MTKVLRHHAPVPALALFLLTLALASLSLVMVYSTRGFRDALQYGDEYHFLKRQAVWVMIGLGFLFFAARTDYTRLARWSQPIMWFSLLLLLLCYAPVIGHPVRGQSRWISLGGFTFQPSELAKLALVIFMADTLTRKRAQIRSFTLGFLPAAAIAGVFMLVIVLEQDLGATVIVGAIVWLMWFVAGMRLTHLLSLFLAAVPAAAIFILSAPWRVQRVLAYFNPQGHIQESGLQLDQSLIAIGSGGVFGRGLGTGHQKYYFLPDGHTDFIFAHIGEELGLVGCLAVLLAFLVIMVIGVVTALRMPDLFGSLLACGLTVMLVLPALVNMAVVVGLLPTKGLALPLISYGGSQMVVNMTALGILMNIVYHRQRTVDERRRRRR
jgi:cell division protein FtsW